MNIAGIDKAIVLAALYNRARTIGLAGMMDFDPTPLDVLVARKIIKERRGANPLYFDYFQGRCMKIDLSRDEVDTTLFDNEYGPGAAQRALDAASAVDADMKKK